MNIIRTKNNILTQYSPKSWLRESVSASGTSLKVKNDAGFATNQYAQIGSTGLEKTELKLISSVGSNALTISATEFDHPTDTPIFGLLYNQIKIYRSITGATGTFTLLATVDIDVDREETIYKDTGGTSAHAYKTTFYNSTTSLESEYSAIILPAGKELWTLQSMRESVMSEFNDPLPKFLTEDQIDKWINLWLLIMTRTARSINQDFGIKSTDISLSSGVAEYDTDNGFPKDFVSPIKVEISWSGSDSDLKDVSQ